MALSQSAVSELLEAFRAGEGVDLIRESVRMVLQELIETEAAAVIGAARYERTSTRVTERNRGRERVLSTQAGDVSLRIPKLRQGAFFPVILEPRRRIDQALHAVVMEAYVHGVSTRSVDDLVTALGIDTGISKSEVSRICAGLDEAVAAFGARILGHVGFPYVYLDATYLHVREGARADLAGQYLFAGLPIEQLSPLATVATTRRLDRGEVLIRVGDRADELYVVAAGEVKDTVADADGNEVVHFLHGPGMTFGEPGFFAVDHRRIVEVAATAPSVVVRLDRRDLVPFMARHPSTKDRGVEKLASNERWQTTMISSLATKPLRDRLVLRLLELVDSNAAREDGLAVTPKVSQSTLAAMVGVSRENLNRAMSTLVAGGLIRQEKGRYVLLDETRLRRQVVQGGGPMAPRRDHPLGGDNGPPRETWGGWSSG